MRILMIARYLPQEGSTTHMYTLSKELIKMGHCVSILSAGPNKSIGANNIYNESLKYGVIHSKIGFPANPNFNFIGKIFQLLRYLIVTPSALIKIKKFNPDIIHVHYPVTSYLAKIYSILYKKKFVVTHHITKIPKHILNRKGNGAIAISSEFYNELISRYKYRKEEVFLIHNGVDIDRYNTENTIMINSVCKENDIPCGNKLIIGFVGSIIYRKGLDILIDALSGIDPSLYHIVIIGDGDKNWLMSMLSQKIESKNYTVKGFVEPDNYYKIFDVLVLPSRQEGFPLVPLEAMANGTLVIRSNVEGASEQIEHNVDGFLFENENYLQLRDILLNILSKTVEVEKIIAFAKKKVIENFSSNAMTNKTMKVYDKIIGDIHE